MSRDRSERGYRAATDALDERPSAATRAAILAAAAREVQAGPRDAREPIVAPRATPRKRWPYAAAAAVLLSSLAVMMATRTEREMPSFTAPVESVAERAAPPAPMPSSEPPQSAAAPPVSQEVAPAPVATAKPQKHANAESSRVNATVAAGEAKVTLPAEAPRAKEEVAALRDAPAPAAAPVPPASAEAAPAAGVGATGAVRADADASHAPTASEWLERIIKLRRAGRHDEADAELKRFRENYPQVTVPAEAMPATGTR